MTQLDIQLSDILRDYVSPINANCILSLATARAKVDLAFLRSSEKQSLLVELEKGASLWVRDPKKIKELVVRFRQALTLPTEAPPSPRSVPARHEPSSSIPLKAPSCPPTVRVIPIILESDIVKARTAGRDLCRDLGFPAAAQAKAATAISELARNIVMYAGRGEIRLTQIDGGLRGIEIVATDSGPGIANLDDIFSGKHRSERGMGIGLRGTRNLMDTMDVETVVGEGTKVTARLYVR